MSRRIGMNCCGSPHRYAPAPPPLRRCFAACPPIRDRTDWPSRCASWAASNARSSCSTRSEEHTSELQSLMRISYAVFCLKKKTILKHQSCHHAYKEKTKVITTATHTKHRRITNTQ